MAFSNLKGGKKIYKKEIFRYNHHFYKILFVFDNNLKLLTLNYLIEVEIIDKLENKKEKLHLRIK